MHKSEKKKEDGSGKKRKVGQEVKCEASELTAPIAKAGPKVAQYVASKPVRIQAEEPVPMDDVAPAVVWSIPVTPSVLILEKKAGSKPGAKIKGRGRPKLDHTTVLMLWRQSKLSRQSVVRETH